MKVTVPPRKLRWLPGIFTIFFLKADTSSKIIILLFGGILAYEGSLYIIYIYISVLPIQRNPRCDDVAGILSAVSHIPRVLPPPSYECFIDFGVAIIIKHYRLGLGTTLLHLHYRDDTNTIGIILLASPTGQVLAFQFLLKMA